MMGIMPAPRLDAPETQPPRPRGANVEAARVLRTSTVTRRDDRFEYWRALFPGFRLEAEDRSAAKDFWGELLHIPGPEEASFNRVRADAARSLALPEDANDRVLLLSLQHGQLECRDRRGEVIGRFGPGTLVRLDYDEPLELRLTRSECHYLRFPLARVAALLGEASRRNGNGVTDITREPLAPFVRAQLQQLAGGGEPLDAASSAALVGAAEDLALALLVHAAGEAPSPGTGLLRMAKRYVDRNLHRPELTPEQVATAVRCSRSQLYRMFATEGVGVLEYIQEARLRRVRELLRSRPTESIGAVASVCGFLDSSSFSRLFRRRYGISPRRWRAANGVDARTKESGRTV